MHLALYLLTTIIPGDRIRFFVENAGSMRTEHFRFMRACLGLQHLQKADLTWCTSVISPANRLRIFFQNNAQHESHEAQAYHPADLAWPDDWSPLVMHERGILRDVSSRSLLGSSVILLWGTAGPAITLLPSCGVSLTGILEIALLL